MSPSRFAILPFILLSGAMVGACASDEISSQQQRATGKPGFDWCAEYGWYDDEDGYCDDPGGYCAMPDPDCGPEVDACGDTAESVGKVWNGDPHVGCVSASPEVEVILTEPYCDLCDEYDKEILLDRSAMIAKVVELIDGAQSTLDIAQYTFSRDKIADAIERAHNRGVLVRQAMDSSQDQPDRPPVELRDKGVDVRFITGAHNGSYYGLMHAKFMLVDGRILMTGSNNYSSTGTSINEENSIVLRATETDPKIAGFQCHFEAIWNSDTSAVGACSNGGITFAPGSAPRKMIRDQIRAAQHSVDVIMHHFTFSDLVKELRNAAQNGVRVRVLVNEIDRAEHSGGYWDELLAAGGQLRFKRVNEGTSQRLHHKLAIIDGKYLINGSGNWSGSAFFNNYENFLLWEHPRVVRRFRELYHRLWTWSLSAASLDQGLSAADQHAATTHHYFGNLHAHFAARDGDVLLDDGEPLQMDESGQLIEIDVGDTVHEVARWSYEYARDQGQMDFLALTPHCRLQVDNPNEANMSQAGFDETLTAAAQVSSESFVAIAGMEWSTISAGNHVNVFNSSAIANLEKGRFDALYEEFLPQREALGDQPLMMLNHPHTFRINLDSFGGGWDMEFGINLLDVPSNGDRNKKFNDYGLDDYPPLSLVRDSWIAGEVLTDAATVDATWANLYQAASPYIRLMEVTIARGNSIAHTNGENPSLVPVDGQQGVLERKIRTHTDFDYFLTRGFYLAPTASHDNEYANFGTGHSSRTVVINEQLSARDLYAAIEQRSVYASEDQNLELRFYLDGRIPMGSRTATPKGSISAQLWLDDPDYDGPYTLAVYHGVVGVDGVSISQQHEVASEGWHALTLAVEEPGEHFFYIEVFEVGANRMAWTAPIWVERI